MESFKLLSISPVVWFSLDLDFSNFYEQVNRHILQKDQNTLDSIYTQKTWRIHVIPSTAPKLLILEDMALGIDAS